MAKNIMYGRGILIVVGLGLYMELTSGDYPIIEKLFHENPAKIDGGKAPAEPKHSLEKQK